MPPNPAITNKWTGPIDWLGGIEVCTDAYYGTYIDPSGCGHTGYPSPVSGKLSDTRDTTSLKFIDCSGFSTIQDCMKNTTIRKPLDQAYSYFYNNKQNRYALILDTPHRFCSYSVDATTKKPLSQIDLNKVGNDESLAYSTEQNQWNGYTHSWGFMPIKEYDIDNGTITYDNEGDTCFENFLLFDTSDNDSVSKQKTLKLSDVKTLLKNHQTIKGSTVQINNINNQLTSLNTQVGTLNMLIKNGKYDDAKKLLPTLQTTLNNIQSTIKQINPNGSSVVMNKLKTLNGVITGIQTQLNNAKSMIPTPPPDTSGTLIPTPVGPSGGGGGGGGGGTDLGGGGSGGGGPDPSQQNNINLIFVLTTICVFLLYVFFRKKK